MADGTKIEWTDATWNVINGCSVVSPGCTNCYAMKLAGSRLRHIESRKGLTVDTKAGPVWTGETRFNEAVEFQPRSWKRPRKIFVCAHGDAFHPSVSFNDIDRVMAMTVEAPQHIYQFLTKRPDRAREYFEALPERQREWSCHAALDWSELPLPNVWLGVSIEDRTRMEERAPILAQINTAVKFWSAEPLLGDLGEIPAEWMPDWMIVGGESGASARPMHPDWARGLRDQCAESGTAFLFKQWGEWVPGESISHEHIMTRSEQGAHWFNGRWSCQDYTPAQSEELHSDDAPDLWRVGKRNATRFLDGVLHNEFPKTTGAAHV